MLLLSLCYPFRVGSEIYIFKKTYLEKAEKKHIGLRLRKISLCVIKIRDEATQDNGSPFLTNLMGKGHIYDPLQTMHKVGDKLNALTYL